jgi:hypothetical protein
MPRPDLSRVPEFFHNYTNQVPENDLMEAFEKETPAFILFLESIPADKHDYRYAEGKWTIKEVLQHIIDCERIFDCRALWFARKDPAALPGFDENIFAENAKASRRDWTDMLEEFKTVRKSSQLLFASFDEEQLSTNGISGNRSNYVLGWGYILIGHSLHHLRILKERYLTAHSF